MSFASSRWKYGPSCRACGKRVSRKRCKGMCQQCYAKKYKRTNRQRINEVARAAYKKDPLKVMARLKKRFQQRKLEAMMKMGGRCLCCGETNPIFLCLDHIKGGGRREHAKRNPQQIWKDAMRQGLPRNKYRLLCWNCNAALGLYGYCPHSNLKSPRYQTQSKYFSANQSPKT